MTAVNHQTGEITEALDAHPAASVWPMLDEADLRRLADDIRENGLLHPILVDGDGRILDGRNRYAACRLAGIEPKVETYEGDPVALVLSANNERRHLTTGQRAMATALTLAADGKRRNGRWARGSVPDNRQLSDSGWEQQMRRAGAVLDHAPALAAQVVTGALALSAAHDQAVANREATERIADLGPDLAALIESGVIDIAEAEKRLADEKRRAEERKRIKALDPDLAQRVKDGLDLGEAELVMNQRRERVAAWATSVVDAIGVLARMAGHPVPGDLAARLEAAHAGALRAVLSTLAERNDLDDLRKQA